MSEFFSWQNKSSETIQVDDLNVTLQSQVLQIRIPPFGGYVWHRPVAVIVEGNGDPQTIPILDVTRRAIWAFMGLTILVNLLLLLAHSAQNQRSA